MGSDDPTEELRVDVTAELREVPDTGENNGSPLVWLAIAGGLLAVAIAVIVLIGQGNDGDDPTAEEVAGNVSTPTNPPSLSTESTPVIGDPAASATDDFDSTADTSPPDEASDEATSAEVIPDEAAPDEDPADEADQSPTTTSAPGPSATLDLPPGPLIDGSPVVTVTADDFEVRLATTACTTIEWSFAGEGQAANYTSEDDCFAEHILSPRPEHPLQPDTSYEVTASFEADGVMEVVTFSVTTSS